MRLSKLQELNMYFFQECRTLPLSVLALNFLSLLKNQPYLVGVFFPLSTETKILELPNPPYNKRFREKETYQGEYTKEVQKDLCGSN